MTDADYYLVQSVVSACGVIVAVFGFLLVILQLRKSSHSDIYALGIATKQAMLDNPALRKYFHDNQELDTGNETEKAQAETLADMYCLYLEQIAVYANELGGEKAAWNNYIGEMYDSSPVIRDRINHSINGRRFYVRKLYDAIDKTKTLQDSGP